MIQRKLIHQLRAWRLREKRKPLIIRGARQVGKTTLVNYFGKEFTHFIGLNLELSKDKEVFERFSDVKLLVQALFLREGVPANQPDILLFIDEIQASPKAIQMLRYFKEELSEIHVIAAGSLLEHALGSVESFPVGRVEYLMMHPISFDEYLAAANPVAKDIFNQVPIPDFAHQTLLDLFHEYAIIGGLPEVVANFLPNKDFTSLVPIYESLVQSFKDDVKKYAKNENEARILRHIIETAPYEADKRVTLHNFGNSEYRSREVGEAMRSLELAGLLSLIYPTTATELPALPDLKKSPRLQLLDTGLMNYQAGLQQEMLGIQDLSQLYRGRIVQHLVTQEIISTKYHPSFKPMFWVRERSDSQAEVDLAYPFRAKLFPVEVKAGKDGKLRSLHQFMDRCPHPFAVRFHANYFKKVEIATVEGKPFYLMNLPYYLASKIEEYMDLLLA